MLRNLKNIGRVAGKSLISGFTQPGPNNYASRIAGMKKAKTGTKLLAGTSRYVGQTAKALIDPNMIGGMAMSYVPMMMMSNMGGQEMNYETQEALAPSAPSQQNYSASNIMQPTQDDLIRMQAQEMNGYYSS